MHITNSGVWFLVVAAVLYFFACFLFWAIAAGGSQRQRDPTLDELDQEYRDWEDRGRL